MASVFDRIEDKVEYITWHDVVREGFVDSQTISPWFAYRVEVKAYVPGIDVVFEEMAKFFPERKANPYIGPIQDEPSKLYYKTKLGNLGNHEYKMITNPTTEDLKMVMAIIRQATATYQS